MSVELIGIIAASIALGTAWLASIRSLRQELREQRSELLDRLAAMENGIRGDMKAMRGELRDDDSGLRGDMKAMESGIRGDMKAMENGIRGDMKAMENGIRGEIRELREETRDSDAGLRAEMHSGFKELGDRVTNVGDRLSKVEGIIEGMFWSGRNQPPDKPREGAA
ncbi:MAG: hypothetical protein OXH96_16715 [Spirochaetaceae bacterium]|nr:hypothetical protein [Spirochaetaceae bacterium]